MSGIRGFEACSTALNHLLTGANLRLASASKEQLTQLVDDISRELVDFTARSEPKDYYDFDECQQINMLDALADKARHAMVAAAIGNAVNGILDATSELNQIIKKLKAETAQNEKTAKAIRLEPLIKTVGAMSTFIQDLKKANQDLADQTDLGAVADCVAKVLLAYQELDKALKPH